MFLGDTVILGCASVGCSVFDCGLFGVSGKEGERMQCNKFLRMEVKAIVVMVKS